MTSEGRMQKHNAIGKQKLFFWWYSYGTGHHGS